MGHTEDGRQYFFTNPYQPTGDGKDGREFLALYLFDRKGALLDAQIDDLGRRSTLDLVRVETLRNERLRSLGKVKQARITMAPFSVERFGTTFGLVAQEDDEGGWTVVMQPGSSMVFYPPWDSGVYDT